jgi:hypothetical protein
MHLSELPLEMGFETAHTKKASPHMINYVLCTYGVENPKMEEDVGYDPATNTVIRYCRCRADGGLPRCRLTESKLSHLEQHAYETMKAAWFKDYPAWLRENKKACLEGTLPTSEDFKQRVFHDLHDTCEEGVNRELLQIRACVREYCPSECPFDIMPTVLFENGHGTFVFIKLTYVRKRWIMNQETLREALDTFHLFDGELLYFKRMPEDTASVPAPSDRDRVIHELLPAWTDAAAEEINAFHAQFNPPTKIVPFGPGETCLPRLLQCKKALLSAPNATECSSAIRAFVEQDTGMRIPKFVNEMDEDYEAILEDLTEEGMGLPMYLDSGADMKYYSAWKMVLVPYSDIVARGIDAVLEEVNPPELFAEDVRCSCTRFV